MILGTATSKNGVTIRLTDERWLHIITSHKEINAEDFLKIISVVEDPDVVLKGDVGELLAVHKVPRKKRWIVVAYKETFLSDESKEANGTDGFVLTAYITTDSRWLFQKEVRWNKE